MKIQKKITAELAEFCLNTQTLPASVERMCRLCLIDWFGAALGGSREALAAPLMSTIRRLDASSQSFVVGSVMRTSCAHAALVNGTLSHALELDDVHLKSAIHGSAPVWAAALAVGEFLEASPREIMLAFAVGYEVMARVGLPAGQRMIAANHHPTGVLGYFGAAAAAGKLLHLNADQQSIAFGIAAGQAGASTQVRGTMSKPFFAGHSAHGGILSAFMAESGFLSARNAFEGEQGVLATYAPGEDTAMVLHGLGRDWEVDQNAFKVHASCAMSHALVDGLLELRTRYALRTTDVQAITLRLFPHCTEYLNKAEVVSGLAGKFSAQYCAAVALIDGAAQEGQFDDARAADREVHRVMALVKLVSDDKYALDQAHVTVVLHDGSVLTEEVLAVEGSPQKPVADEMLDAKFLNLAGRALPADVSNALLETLKMWPEIDLTTIIQLGASAGRGAE